MKKLLLLLFALSLAGCAAKPQPPQYEKPVIALLDTGISTAAIDEASLLEGHNYVTGSHDTEDRLDHGTAVASVIVGCEPAGVEALAPDVLLLPLVVTDESGSVPPETLAQVIRDAVDVYGADIINLSLGIKKDVPKLQKAVEYAEKQGVLVISAAGNGGDSPDLYYPAAYETVLAVGSHDRTGAVSDFSQRNGTADLLAPGEDVWFASRDGRTLGARGTSYATGYVSAAAALLLTAKPELTPADLRDRLCSTATDVAPAGFDAASGWGILNPEAALGS